MRTKVLYRIYAITLAINIVVVLIFALMNWYFKGNPYIAFWALLVTLPTSLWLSYVFHQRLVNLIEALRSGLLTLKDADYSTTITPTVSDEWQEVVGMFNDISENLRKERQTIYQRELMLDHVMQYSPVAMVLTNSKHTILYSNVSARDLFHQGERIEGRHFFELIETMPTSLIEAVDSGQECLFSMKRENEDDFFHLSRSQFTLNNQHHHLYLFKILTRELNRQEVATWKKVIRVISHEINNSLAPLSSMAHSGKILAGDNQKLNLVFNTIAERVEHLNQFIQGYAQFSKLPSPRLKNVDWLSFINSLKQQVDFNTIDDDQNTALYIDSAQMEHVLINLIKNAHEADSTKEDIRVFVRNERDSIKIIVQDRGKGMSEKVLQNALVPFYSTKQSGTGLGLALCREITEAHNGKLSISNRPDGGLEVTIQLPLPNLLDPVQS